MPALMTSVWAAAALVARAATARTAGRGFSRLVTRSLIQGGAFEIGRTVVEWIWSQWGLDFDPEGEDGLPPATGNNCNRCVIAEPSNPDNTLGFIRGDTGAVALVGGFQGIQRLYSWNLVECRPEDPYCRYEFFIKNYAGNDVTQQETIGKSRDPQCFFIAGNQPPNFIPTECGGTGGDTPGDEQPGETIYYNEGDCTYKATWQMFIVDDTGKGYGDVVLIEPDDRGGNKRAISKCEIKPTFIYQPVNGDPDQYIDPYKPDGGWKSLEEIAEEIGEDVRNSAEEIIQQINDRLDELIPEVPGGSFKLEAICEVDAEGNKLDPQPEVEWTYAGGPAPEVAVNQLKLVDNMLQTHLAWKTPTCNARPPKEGDWVTIEFISDENSPMGDRPIRKLFRYRSKGGKDLGQLIDYWKDFSWSAGSVCVIHKGAWWGTPQSWARDASEGKRLIQYAAAEAGLDPDQVGEWKISGSDNSRYGMPGTMRVRINKGTYCITNRLGPSGLPLVGIVPTDP